MNSLVTFLRQLRQLFAPVEGHERQNKRPRTIAGRLNGDRDDAINRLMMVKIGWTFSFLMFLAAFTPDGDHLKRFEWLLHTYALVDAVLATLFREKWSATNLSRWDEAIFFATVSLGLRLFA